MPGARCAVSVCKNNFKNARKSGLKLSFHRFPAKNEEICKAWVQKCNRKEEFNLSTNFICSEHFSDADFERDLKAELMNLPTKRRLIPTAIPWLNLTQDTHVIEALTTVLEPPTEFEHKPPTAEIIEENYRLLSKEHEIMMENFREQSKRKDEIILQQKLEIKNLKKTVAKLQSDISIENTYRTGMEKRLNKFLSKTQREILFGRKTKVIWSGEDFENAVNIRSFSKQCYMYLRDEMHYPLPSVSTLQRGTSELNAQQRV